MTTNSNQNEDRLAKNVKTEVCGGHNVMLENSPRGGAMARGLDKLETVCYDYHDCVRGRGLLNRHSLSSTAHEKSLVVCVFNLSV